MLRRITSGSMSVPSETKNNATNASRIGTNRSWASCKSADPLSTDRR